MDKKNVKKESWPIEVGLNYYGVNEKVVIFLGESNKIEREYSIEALVDATKAWNYLTEKKVLTLEVILKTHKLLMKNLCPDIAGKWRDCDVWIGGQKKFFVSETLIKDDIKKLISLSEKLLKWGQTQSDEIKEEICKLLHVAFENIHGHVDGNGRTYRLVLNWHRLKLGLPILIINADLKEKGYKSEQISYYHWFRYSSDNNLAEFIKRNKIQISKK